MARTTPRIDKSILVHHVDTREESTLSNLDRGQPASAWMPAASKDEYPAPDAEPAGDALLATKLYMAPPRRGLVRRPRLIERLSAGLRDPLTLIVAPAGFGKTTLLGDWRVAKGEGAWPIAWLALDAGDNDLARFLRYIVAALQTLSPGIGLSVLASLRSPRTPPVEAVLTPLLNDLASLPDDIILVLDDYHVLDVSPIHRAMTFLLDHLPPRIHMVITTRVDPPLPLARLRARGQMTELRAADLRFTSDETDAFLSHTMGLRLAPDIVARLEACTEGWITGLQLAALVLEGRDPVQIAETIAGSTRANRFILDYLADEVFNRQPAEVRRFLLRTSVLDRLNGALCDAMVAGAEDDRAVEDGRAMLERLDRANLFLVPLDPTGTWYRYHHLFGGFLRERLHREHPDLVSDVHRRACRWYEQQGLLTEAADHALAACDYALAAQLVEQVFPVMLWQRGELATLLRWLEQLPREVTRTRPRLSLDLAWALLWSARVEAIEPRLRDAEQALETPEPPSELDPRAADRAVRGEIAAIRAELARQEGDLAAAIDLARQALADLPEEDRRVRGVTTGLLAGAYLWSGDAAAASHAYAEAVALSQTSSTITLALIASGRLVLAQALRGRLHQAATTYRQTLDLAAAHAMAATQAIGVAEIGMAEVLREWSDLDAAEALVRQGIERCTESGGMAEMAVDGCLTLARVLRARGDSDGALAGLRQAEALGRDGHVAWYAERVAVERARLWLDGTADDVAAALRWAVARECSWRAEKSPGYLGMIEGLTLARLWIIQGRHDDAAAALKRLIGMAEAGSLIGCLIEILALRARIFLEQARMAEAMIALTRALSLGEPEGYLRVFVDEGAHMAALLRQARIRDVAPVYVARLIAACGNGPLAASPAASVSVLVDPLSARELELLRLLAAGLSAAEIAARLFITSGTVRNHLKNIYGKLDVHNRVQAVERARALRLL
ncbi:MAG TPA: LuxR C-terminal-related transcriptional regulator [Chloroflexota bacterium]|nr:LuxR C-terminal-related transcriptional regulator [Chloroflexota bacterium]